MWIQSTVVCFFIFQVLNETFGKDAFLMNGLVQGIKVCSHC